MVTDVLLYRPEEAAAKLGISRAKCYELIAEGVLPHMRVGRSLRIPAADLRRWIEQQTEDTIQGELGVPRPL